MTQADCQEIRESLRLVQTRVERLTWAVIALATLTAGGSIEWIKALLLGTV